MYSASSKLKSDKKSKRETEDKLRDIINNDDVCADGKCAACFDRYLKSNGSEDDACPVCYTKDCTVTAAYQLSAMDPTADPCTDFYQFACGNFIRKHIVPDGQLSFSNIDVFYADLALHFKYLVENLATTSKAKVINKIQETYHTCINALDNPEKELEALKAFITDFLQWPLAVGDQWKPRFDSLTSMIINLEYHGYGNQLYPFDIQKNGSELKIMLKPGLINMYSELQHIEDEALRKKEEKSQTLWLGLMKNLVAALGNTDEQSIAHDMQDMKRLANEYLFAQKHGGNSGVPPPPKEITIDELYQLTDNEVEWLNIFNARVNRFGYSFNMEDKVILHDSDNFKVYVTTIGRFTDRTVSNAIGWLTVFHEPMWNAGPIAEKLILQYENEGGEMPALSLRSAVEVLEREKTPGQRWNYCVQILKIAYPNALTRLYADKYIDKSNKKSADELIIKMLYAYKKMINESSWLDENTKARALKKADFIKRHVGYSDYIFNDEELDRDYAHMPEPKPTHFENFLAHKAVLSNAKFYDIPVRERWYATGPLTVNAFYSAEDNDIWFPTVTLQVPFFDNTRMAAVNFGLMGAAIGHEIGHAFDSQGSQYNERGALENWWSAEVNKIYSEKVDCLIQQYDSYCPEELQGGEEKICVKGQTTVGENLADNTGLAAAFLAYKSWVKDNGVEKRLPGLEEYTPKQLFFMSYAYFYCENIPPGNWLASYGDDEHAPHKYRVIGTLSNSPDFRETFNCPEGLMNRGSKSCKVW